ncbi:hypothetical protein EVAR_40249_1 [Eumeta japonica]|uniref:Uncharacterized protein n=1 Tax=Eumeta variegata TaxID=151549 RepID=A0A4C1Y5E7_EUMVA|nr:hypothetical protein EVAR_40249_1 [Eumeta japonica]
MSAATGVFLARTRVESAGQASSGGNVARIVLFASSFDTLELIWFNVQESLTAVTFIYSPVISREKAPDNFDAKAERAMNNDHYRERHPHRAAGQVPLAGDICTAAGPLPGSRLRKPGLI